jgi:hypothetical protein
LWEKWLAHATSGVRRDPDTFGRPEWCRRTYSSRLCGVRSPQSRPGRGCACISTPQTAHAWWGTVARGTGLRARVPHRRRENRGRSKYMPCGGNNSFGRGHTPLIMPVAQFFVEIEVIGRGWLMWAAEQSCHRPVAQFSPKKSCGPSLRSPYPPPERKNHPLRPSGP